MPRGGNPHGGAGPHNMQGARGTGQYLAFSKVQARAHHIVFCQLNVILYLFDQESTAPLHLTLFTTMINDVIMCVCVYKNTVTIPLCV